jgi:hypothetical protein
MTVRELLDQLSAEASQVSPNGLDEARRERLAVIQDRIRELRAAVGLVDG